MNARRFLIGSLLAVILVVLVASLSLPQRARPADLEVRFHDQIERLRQIAYDTKGRWNTSLESCDADRHLFDRPAILYASVEPKPDYHLVVGDKRFDWSSDVSIPMLSFSSADLYRHWYATSGGRVSAVLYHVKVMDKDRHPVGITLIIDIKKLDQ